MPELGLVRDRTDSNAPLPFGFTHTAATGSSPEKPSFRVVQTTCVACHSNRIEFPDGTRRTLIGAPSTTFDIALFRSKVLQTTRHENFTSAHLRDLVAAKEAARSKGEVSWIFKDIASEGQHQFEVKALLLGKKTLPDGTLVAVSDLLVQGMKQSSELRAGQLGRLLGAGGPGTGTAIHQPGQVDGVGGGMAMLGISPHESTSVDIPSTWRQDTRPMGQYDGTTISGFMRNLGAVSSAAEVSGPKSPICKSSLVDGCIPQPDLSVFVAYQTWSAVDRLPSPRYPASMISEAQQTTPTTLDVLFSRSIAAHVTRCPIATGRFLQRPCLSLSRTIQVPTRCGRFSSRADRLLFSPPRC